MSQNVIQIILTSLSESLESPYCKVNTALHIYHRSGCHGISPAETCIASQHMSASQAIYCLRDRHRRMTHGPGCDTIPPPLSSRARLPPADGVTTAQIQQAFTAIYRLTSSGCWWPRQNTQLSQCCLKPCCTVMRDLTDAVLWANIFCFSVLVLLSAFNEVYRTHWTSGIHHLCLLIIYTDDLCWLVSVILSALLLIDFPMLKETLRHLIVLLILIN